MLKNLLKKTERGFTIIEVMIVLAIAGLILVVVLIAIPQLQRNQRDTARQNVASRLTTELGTYSTNNNGTYPFTAATMTDFNTRYITGVPPAPVILELRNPQTGNQYAVTLAASAASVPTADQLMVYPGMSCNGEAVQGTYSATGTSRQFALRVLLERSNTFFCADNS